MAKKEEEKKYNLDFEQARFEALRRMPYLSAALYALKVIITDKFPFPAAITQHGRLLINPAKCGELKSEQTGTILLHEVMHLLNDHFDRANAVVGVDRKVWNYAGDFEINDNLIAAGCPIPTFADGGTILLPHRFGFQTDELAETYYEMLQEKIKEQKGQGQGQGGKGLELPDHNCGSGAGNILPGEEEFDDGQGGLTKEDKERIKGEVAASMNEHVRQGGFIPAGMKRWAEKILQGKPIDWKKQLAKSIKKFIGTARGTQNPTFNKISRRQHASPDIILPAYNNLVPKLGVLLDTSGSMSEKDLGEGLYQIKKIFSQIPETEIWLAVVDAEVYSVSRVKNMRDIEAKIQGGGGTVFTEVFDRLEEKGVSCIVGISDCCASFPAEHPKAKVIWLTSYKNAEPPFGQVITINRDGED